MNNSALQTLSSGTIIKSDKREYTIERVLGAGAFGITYIATAKVGDGNVFFDARYAIKEHFTSKCLRDANGRDVLCSKADLAEVKQTLADFIVEARQLEKLCKRSKNIVNVNETFEANGTAYYVMEYLDGGNVHQMSETDAVETIKQIASAVSAIHSERVLHLDIKPENIVFKTDKTGTYPVLIDFGVAKYFDKKGNLTGNNKVCGASLGYAPPEQYEGVTTFAPTLDVYALGATLLYLLTGKEPPCSKDISVSQRELSDMMPATISPNVRQTILNAMKPSPFERTPNVAAFLQSLRGSGKDVVVDGLSSRGKGTEMIMINSGSKHKKMFLYGGIAAVLLVICLIFVLSGNNGNVTPVTPVADSTVVDTLKHDTAAAPTIKTQTPSPAATVTPKDNPTQTPTTTSTTTQSKKEKVANPTNGTVNLGYATYTGALKNGKPDGQGTLTFRRSHAIDSRASDKVADEGDRVTGEFVDGHLSFGKWYKSSGETETLVIGE